MELSFIEHSTLLFEQLGNHKTMVLSTSYEDHITSRMMSIVIINDLFYFQTDKNFRKYIQLQKNNKAALCIDNFQIEGICKEIGKPLDNQQFCELFKKHYLGSYTAYSSLDNERLFILEPQYIKKWIYEDCKSYEEVYNFIEKIYRKKLYTGK